MILNRRLSRTSGPTSSRTSFTAPSWAYFTSPFEGTPRVEGGASAVSFENHSAFMPQFAKNFPRYGLYAEWSSSSNTARQALSSAPSTHACRTLMASPAKWRRPLAAGVFRLSYTLRNFPGPKKAKAPVSRENLSVRRYCRRRDHTHRVRILRPVPRERAYELISQELYGDVVDGGEILQHEVRQDLILVPDERS